MSNHTLFGGSIPGYSGQLFGKFQGTIWLVVLLTVSGASRFLQGKLGGVVDLTYISPFALEYVTADGLKALLFTCASTGIGFAVALVAGYVLAVLTSMAATSRASWFRIAAAAVDKLFDFFYIVPVVVTLGLAMALLLNALLHDGMPRWIVTAGTIFTATFVLGGYQIFQAIYAANCTPSRRSEVLVDALYSKADDAPRALHRLYAALIRVLRLRDSAILNYTDGIVRAFHLSLVSVVIAESIHSRLYEFLVSQSDASPAYLGGVGQIIVSAQNYTNFQLIVGMLWSLFLFDVIVVFAIRAYLYGRFLRYYTGQ